jgi:hypothetical protein
MLSTVKPVAEKPKQEVSEFIFKLKQLDLEPIAYKLQNPDDRDGWDSEKTDVAIQAYRVFLLLNFLYPSISIVPTKTIDEVWHTHILDTALYAVHCDELFGKLLHHFPYFGIRGPEDRANLEAAFELTKDLFNKHGHLIGLNNFSALCGSSCGGSLCDNNSCDSNSCGTEDITNLVLMYANRPRR